MQRRIVGACVVAAALATMARAGVVIDLRPDFSGAPFQSGDVVPVEIFLYTDDGSVLPNMRQVMFDWQSNTSGADSGNIFVDETDQSLIQWTDLFDDNFYFTDPLPIPQRNYVIPQPGPGLWDMTGMPIKAADAFVTYLNDGYFDVTNPDAQNERDEGAQFHSGFGEGIDGNPIRHFSSQNAGEVSGGRVFIPEPATLSLMLIGAGLLMRRRRKA